MDQQRNSGMEYPLGLDTNLELWVEQELIIKFSTSNKLIQILSVPGES